jgi:hypothetical protein
MREHKPWFEEGCSILLDQWKQAKLHLNRWKKYFSLFFNVHNVSVAGQIEVDTAEPLVLGPSPLVV